MRIISKVTLAATSAVFMSLTGVAMVGATPNSHANAMASQPTTTTSDSNTNTKLAAAKLRACQNREKAINNIMSRIADRGQKQLNLFTSIATKTETFYTTKGKTLSNYDTLVADVNAKQTAAQTTVDTIKQDSVSFKCDGTDPKGAVTSFKDALTSEISALKAYRTAVKNLIVGVKSVQSTTTTSTGGNQ